MSRSAEYWREGIKRIPIVVLLDSLQCPPCQSYFRKEDKFSESAHLDGCIWIEAWKESEQR